MLRLIQPRTSIPKDTSLRKFLKQFLAENEISAASASSLFKMSRASLEKYMAGETWLWKATQIRPLAEFLNVEVDDIIDAIEQDENSSSDFDTLKACSYILAHFDVKTLKELKIIPPRATIETYENHLKNFFGLESIYDYDAILVHTPLFSKSIRAIEEGKQRRMTEMCLKVAIQTFESIQSPYEYRPDVLEALLKRIRSYTKDIKNGYKKIVMALYRIGITVVTQPYVAKTGLFGVTMIRENKPCIIISDQTKKYHKLWITLIHELYHVLNDYELLKTNGYHMSSPEELFFNEDAADRFAMRVLVPEVYIISLEKSIDIPYIMERAAVELDVHPSIVYGVCFEWFYKFERKKILKKFQVLIDSSETTKEIVFDPIKHNSIKIAIEKIKDTLYKISV